jgi:hypothetical protein
VTSLDRLPGGDLVRAGLRDLEQDIISAAALTVSIGAPRLASLGIAIPHVEPDAEHRLYLMLHEHARDGAHSQYNALIRRLVRFEHALACVR